MTEGTITISKKNLVYAIIGFFIVTIIIGAVVMSSKSEIKTDLPPVTDNSETNAGTTDTPTTESVTPTKATEVKILSQLLEVNRANEKIKTISGRVQNIGNVRALSVMIYAKLYDINNKSIKTEETRPLFNDLNPGQISQYILTTYENFTTYELSVDWIEDK